MGVAAGVVSAVVGLYGVYEAGEQRDLMDEAADEQDRIAAEAAELEKEASAMELDRLSRAQEETLGTARAAAAAGGSGVGGSTGAFIERMTSEFGKELDWLKSSQASSASIAARSSALESSRTRSSARGSYGGVLSGISQGARGAQQVYEQW